MQPLSVILLCLPFLSFIDFFLMCMSVLAYIPVCMCTTWLPSYPQRPKEEVRCPWIRVYGWLTAGYWGQNPGPLQITAHTFKHWANSLASPFFKKKWTGAEETPQQLRALVLIKNSHGSSQHSVTPVPGDPVSSNVHSHHACTWGHIHTRKQGT